MELDCCLWTRRSVDVTGAGSAENGSLAKGDGGATTGTVDCLGDPKPAAEGGGIFTVVGTALEPAAGIFTTTALGLLGTAVAADGLVSEEEVSGCGAGMLITVAAGFGFGSDCLLLGEELLR